MFHGCNELQSWFHTYITRSRRITSAKLVLNENHLIEIFVFLQIMKKCTDYAAFNLCTFKTTVLTKISFLKFSELTNIFYLAVTPSNAAMQSASLQLLLDVRVSCAINDTTNAF